MTMFTRTFTYLLILLSFLSGCAVFTPGDKPPADDGIPDPAKVARQLEIDGHYLEAAHEYLQIAAQMRPPTQQGYQLSAIKAFLKGGMLTEAKAELERLDANQSYGLEIPLEFVQVKIDLAEQKISSALKRLQGIEPTTLPVLERIEYQQLHAQVLAAQGEVFKAVREWINVDQLSDFDPLILKENHQLLWHSLLSHKLNDLKQVEPVPGEVFSGWIALALLAKTSQQKHLQQALNNWELRFPNHPGTQYIVPSLLQDTDPLPPQPQKVALLLPLSGKFGEFAKAVQNGFFAAAKADQEHDHPAIDVHDVNDDNILQVYQKVVNAGVDFIVGPLEKTSLEKLANSQPHLPIPTLGLNHLEMPVTTGNLYQFGLLPEDETKEAARRAWADGHRSAMVLVPDGDWGKRILDAFQAEWERLGGQAVTQHVYGKDFQSSVPKALKQLDAENCIFMVAFPKTAKEMRPLFKSILNDRLPIYSTSHVYGGTPNPNQDDSLNGVMFVDMPWVLAPDQNAIPLQKALQQSWPQEMEKYNRLYALGVDAYGLLLRLQQLNRQQWPGQTGRLSLDNMGVIHREQLRWARFVEGKPHLLDDESH